MAKPQTPSIRLRIDLSPDSALGPGKIALLERIEATGSLSQAARELGMSYRRAWLLLDDVNRMFNDPATTTSVGGSGGRRGASHRPGTRDRQGVSRDRGCRGEGRRRAHRMARQLPTQVGPARRNRVGGPSHLRLASRMLRVSSFVALLGAICISAPLGAEQTYRPPRTLDGHPSFEGNWTNATITSLQRPPRYTSLVIPPGEVAEQTAAHPQVVRQRTDDELDESKPLTGSDLKGGRGYNAFWIDPGTKFARVKGEYRTSWIVDPADGQIPFRAGVRERMDEGRANFDGPEARPLGERCIVNSNSAGPPMLNYLYNNNYEIVQTADALVIRAEMNNYARVVRIGGHHPSATMRTLHGDSVGRWDGETLVIETTHFHPLHASGVVPLTERGKVTERLTRVSPSEILYEFTVEDPGVYARPWRGEMTFNATRERVFEYACHEGNYALPGILAGAREQEKRQAAAH